MSYFYDSNVAYTCGVGANANGDVSVTIGHELNVATNCQTFSFEFVDGALTIRCSKKLAADIASAFATVAET